MIVLHTYVTSKHNVSKVQYNSVDEAFISLSFLYITPTCFSNSKVQEDVSAGSIEFAKKQNSWVDKGGRLG